MSNLAHKIDYQVLDEEPRPLDSANDTGNAARVGGLFKDARHNLNLTVKNVADRIHVRSLYLDAIETGQFDKLPSPLYAAGFIKLYARFLELDGDEILRRINFKYEEDFSPDKMLPITTSIQPSRFAYYVSGALVAVCLGIGAALFFSKAPSSIVDMDAALLKMPEEDSIAGEGENSSAHPVETTATTIAEKAPGAQEGTLQKNEGRSIDTVEGQLPKNSSDSIKTTETLPIKETSATSAPSSDPALMNDETVTFRAHQDCWMEIDKMGVIVFSKILRAGDTFVITSPKEHRVSVGNAPGLEITYHGQKAKPLGEERVVKNISLETFLVG